MNARNFLRIASLLLAVSLMVAAQFADALPNSRRGKAKAQQQEEIYPQATRNAPTIKQSPRLQRTMEKLINANAEGEHELVIETARSVLDNRVAGDYEKSLAWQLIGIARGELDDFSGAIEAFQQAIETGGLDNNGHYNLMFNLAQYQYQEDRFEDAERTMARFLEETQSDDPRFTSFRGATLYQLERYDEAASWLRRAIAASDEPSNNWYQMLLACYLNQDKYDEAAALGEELLAKNPEDNRLIFNLATTYAQAEQYDKATQTLENARAKQLLDERGYRQLYALYMNMDNRENNVVEVINDGLERGILKPNAEVYAMLGQAYYFSDRPNEAIKAYTDGLQYASNGEAALNLARILSNEERHSEARQRAREALDKGLRRPGDAWMVIGRAEFGMGNRAGLIAAYREAAKHPETREAAQEWLKKNASR